MITVRDIQEAHVALAGRIHRTPLFSSRTLGERAGCQLFLKPECLQRTGSFKVRGAINRVRQLSAEEKGRGLVAVSAGNHAQALAFAASLEQVHCTVVMPAHAQQAKVDASRAYGAEVVLHGNVFEAFQMMEDLHRENGYLIVHPFSDPAIMAGQGTAALEFLADAENVDIVVVPVGGGGLISGIATAVKSIQPSARVIGVEPEGARTVQTALQAGAVVNLERIDTIADGLTAPMTSDLVLEHVRAFVDDFVTVTDAEIVDAMAAVLERAKLLAEPAGAAAVAALLSGKIEVRSSDRVVAVVSGGNVGLSRLKELIF